MTVLEFLQKKLRPQYVGWQDQYRAILWALGIDADTPIDDVKAALSLLD